MFSSRSGHDREENALTRALRATREAGRRVVDLTVSNPTAAGIPYASDAILGALSDARALVYEPHAFGIASARSAAAVELGVDPARVMLTASTSEAYSFLFKLLCDPGDEVLVPQPSYPLFELLATFESVRLVPYLLAYDGQWHVDLDSVRRAVGPRTRAILTVSPNNPTGSYLKSTEMRELAALGVPLVSDEVFASYPLGERAPGPSILEVEDVLVFALGGLSKLAALPQMKLAWTVVGGPASARTEAIARLELIADSFLSVGSPVQHALPALLASRAVAARAIRARTATNLAALRRAIGPESPLSLLDVEGGWYATLRLPRTQSEESWLLDFVEAGAHAHPGHFFDFPDEAFAIVSLLTAEEDFGDGVARLVGAVAKHLA